MPEVTSTFRRTPAYRYIRSTDKLPRYDDTIDLRFDGIIAKVRLFNPTGIGTWFIATYDPHTDIAWGVVDLYCREVGSFSMRELLDYRGLFGLPIERDLHFRPVSIASLLSNGEH